MRPDLRRGAVLAWALLVTLTLACGVPISASEITATAVSQPTPGIDALLLQASTSLSTPSAGDSGRLAASPTASMSTTPLAPIETPTAVATATVVAASQPPAPPPVSPGELMARAVQLLNEYRTRSGLTALRPNASLAAAGTAYARLLAERNYFGHDGPDGSTPQSRVAASGYAGQFRGEALAAGQASAEEVINVWLNSPPHAAILLAPASVDVGIGYHFEASDQYRHYWVLLTGIP
jgi:uncharacterized protein YkwD